MRLTEQINQKALDLGFDLVGITDASPLPTDYIERLAAWLDAGYAGKMTWMLENLEKRVNPARLLPGAQSVIVVGLNYKPRSDDRGPGFANGLRRGGQKAEGRRQKTGRVASYARYEDYHPFIKKQLRKLVDFLIHTAGPGLKFKICVDSSPLLERPLAERAGLGFVGKNHMLTNPRFGPQLFLGEIITNLELNSRVTSNESRDTKCDSCDKCVSACPTGALLPNGHFNAAKCINYLTIESDTEIPLDLAPKIGSHLFGCSDCLLACPYQQKAPSCANSQFAYYPDRAQLNLNDILNLTEDQFQNRFVNSPILRPGLAQLKRTAQICINNALTA
ncbi:MAG: tRNA epoxyqueuosine(34) reductase QueG [Sedimentisphaerales bacterium]